MVDGLMEKALERARQKAREAEAEQVAEEEEEPDDPLNPGFDAYYEQYHSDPVGFIENELGEKLAPDMVTLCHELLEYQVLQGKSANAVGKTHLMARIAVWWYICRRGSKVFTSAAPPRSNLENLLWSEIGGIVTKHPEMFRKSSKRKLHISRNEEEFITGVLIPMTGSSEERKARFSGKHAPNLLFIMDEGDAIPADVYEAIDSCMSGGDAKLLIMFNPRGARGAVYKMERDRQARVVPIPALTHPNVITGEDIIPGAVTRNSVVIRINDWTRPLIKGESTEGDDVFDVPEHLVGVVGKRRNGDLTEPLKAGKRRVTNPAFSYMVLARYPAEGARQLISQDWIDRAVGRWERHIGNFGETPPMGIAPIIGHDVASTGQDWNVVYRRYGGWVARPDRWQGVDATESGERGADIYQHYGAQHAIVDATGVGAGTWPIYRRRGCHVTPIQAHNSPSKRCEIGEFYRMRDQMLWSLREWLREDPLAAIPPDERLLEELITPEYAIDYGRIRVTGTEDIISMLGRSPDDMMALAHTFAPQRRRRATGQGSVIVQRSSRMRG